MRAPAYAHRLQSQNPHRAASLDAQDSPDPPDLTGLDTVPHKKLYWRIFSHRERSMKLRGTIRVKFAVLALLVILASSVLTSAIGYSISRSAA